MALTVAPILALLDFFKEFTVEIDVSKVEIGAVLTQNGYPISFLSKALAPSHLGLSAYEKELLPVVMAVQK